MTAMLDEEVRAAAETTGAVAAAALRKVRSLAATAPPSRAFAAIATLTELTARIEDRMAAGIDPAPELGALAVESGRVQADAFVGMKLQSRAG